MSLEIKSIVPTEEELEFLRDKLNEIADIPIDSQISNKISILSNKFKINKNNNKNNNNKNLINNESQTFIFNNNDIESKNIKLKGINNELENYLLNSSEQIKNFENKNFYGTNFKENFDYNEIEKIKYENILLKNKIEEQNKKLEEYSKKINLSKFINNNKNLLSSDYIKLTLLELLNKNKINEENKNILDKIFINNNNENYLDFLFDRIENLEFQNFSLITQIEYYIKIISEMSNDLIEYIEIINDIKNVLNNISIEEKLNDDFFNIRDTLNKKNEIIYIQKNEILKRKNYIESNDIMKKNENILFCNDKIMEMKLLNNNNINNNNYKINFEKSFQILNEKITTYENLKELYEKYEDYLNYIEKSNNENYELENKFKVKNELINYNNLLIQNNLILKNIIINLLKNNNIEYNENIKNIFNNIKKQGFMNDDLFFIFINQAKINELNLLKEKEN